MKLHQLSSISKKKKRVGRGGKRGTTAGRGTKGQRSRAGHRIRPAERDLIMRIPKKRGFSNKPQSSNAAVFNVGELSSRLKREGYDQKTTVTRRLLETMNVLPSRFQGQVKVLGAGEIAMPFNVKGLSVSKEATAKIEKAGGTISA